MSAGGSNALLHSGVGVHASWMHTFHRKQRRRLYHYT